MKRTVRGMALVILCILSNWAKAQDIIITKSGEQLVGRVVEVNTDSVYYQYFSDVNGPSFTMATQEIEHVKFANAVEPEQHVIKSDTEVLRSEASTTMLQTQAKIDANTYYKPKGVFWTTMGATVINPMAGFVTGTLLAAVPTNINEQFNPNRTLLKEPAYHAAYIKEAKKRKIGNAAAGFGAGAAIAGLMYMAVIISAIGQ